MILLVLKVIITQFMVETATILLTLVNLRMRFMAMMVTIS